LEVKATIEHVPSSSEIFILYHPRKTRLKAAPSHFTESVRSTASRHDGRDSVIRCGRKAYNELEEKQSLITDKY
jgi:hypothetical protein